MGIIGTRFSRGACSARNVSSCRRPVCAEQAPRGPFPTTHVVGSLRGAFVPQEIFHHTFANGLTLLGERMEHVRSAALNFLVPAGCVYDAPSTLGMGALLVEMITRGAGTRNSKELSLALDNLGLDR